MQNDQRQQFINFPWSEKIVFMTTFYGEMIKKTDNEEYIARFKAKIDEVKGYEENEENTQKLIELYDRIISAQMKTRAKEIAKEQEKMKQAQEKIQKLKSQELGEMGEDPDDYLADLFANIS